MPLQRTGECGAVMLLQIRGKSDVITERREKDAITDFIGPDKEILFA